MAEFNSLKKFVREAIEKSVALMKIGRVEEAEQLAEKSKEQELKFKEMQRGLYIEMRKRGFTCEELSRRGEA